MENKNNKLTLFVLLGGILLTVLTLASELALSYFGIRNIILYFAVVYGFEFGVFCLTLYLYRIWISKILWFGQAVTLLILICLLKIIISVILLFVLFSFTDRFLEPGLGNLIDLMGPFVRGFILELACIGIASKIFETDIFDKDLNENDRIIDDLK